MARVAINGLGRIGRAAFKIIRETPGLELVAVNDLTPVDNLAYLVQYDSVYGKYEHKVSAEGGDLVVEGKRYKVYTEKDPSKLPWRDLKIDIVFECTGHFRTKEGMQKHIDAGARHVILSAPAKDEDILTFVYGVNAFSGTPPALISCASCTTNSVAPVFEVMGRRFGIKKAILTTVHAYTSSQELVDAPNKKFRRGRAAAVNFVPAETGAAIATTRAMPQYKGKFDGVAIRGPVPVGSISDITFVLERATTEEEVNRVLKEEAGGERYREVMGANEDQIVSSDIIMDTHASIVDLTTTKIVDGDLVKVMAWYDNEWGYTCQMIRSAVVLAKALQGAAV